MLMVGSVALKHFNMCDRVPSDFDVICSTEEYEQSMQRMLDAGWTITRIVENQNKHTVYYKHSTQSVYAEYSLIDVKGDLRASDEEIYNNPVFRTSAKHSFFIGDAYVAFPEVVYMMKLSHMFKDSVHFEKTRADILRLEDKLGDFTTDRLGEWLEILARRKEATYKQKHFSLKKKKNEFFTDNVDYVYDHDSLHEVVAVMGVPAYTLYAADNEEVFSSRAKFEVQPEIVRLLGVYEEACVLALERAIIPHGTDEDTAFKIALRKICTVTTSGWFRDFAWENYDEVLAMKQLFGSITEKFEEAKQAGKIRLYKK